MSEVWVVMNDLTKEPMMVYNSKEVAIDHVINDMKQVYMDKGEENPIIRRLTNEDGELVAFFIRMGRLSKSIYRTTLV